MTDRLISERAAIDEIYSYRVNPDQAISEYPDDVFQYNSGLISAIQAIKSLPTAQSQRTGKWESQHTNIKGDAWIKWSCNCCGYVRNEGWEYTNDGRKPKVFFCENCGADMREGEK